MSDLAAVIRYFPMHELTIRRLYRLTPEFRALCDDYATARSALEHWQADEAKVRDFQQLVAEIGTEIEEAIQAAHTALHRNHREAGS